MWCVMNIVRLSALAAVAVALSSISLASTSLYGDRGVWTSLVSVSGMDTFEGIAGSGSFTAPSSPYGQAVATYSNVNGSLFVISSTYYGPGSAPSDFLLQAYGSPDTLTVTFNTPTYAGGLDISSLLSFNTSDMNVMLSDGTTAVVPGAGMPSAAFLGFISDTLITGLTIDHVDPAAYTAIDNVTVASVPEPASMTVLALASLAALRRRKA